MYAVMVSGGKQHRVQPGDIIQVEKLEGAVGTAVKFDQVLFASKGEGAVWIGQPTLSGAMVEAEVVGDGRDEKILIIKMKRRKQYRRTQGHRQYQTQLLITSVSNGAGESAKLSDEDKKKKLSTFHTHLTPKGLAFTPKTLGSRVRAKKAKLAGGTTAAAEKAAPAKAAAKPAAKKTAAKKKAE